LGDPRSPVPPERPEVPGASGSAERCGLRLVEDSRADADASLITSRPRRNPLSFADSMLLVAGSALFFFYLASVGLCVERLAHWLYGA
jgi:hypothetical protein